MSEAEPSWLVWARELQAIAQSGLHFSRDPYDRQRYEMIQSLAARMMADQSGQGHPKIMDLFAEQSGYATPKVDVRGAVFDGAKVLLVRELSDGGRWTLPGGWADVNQSPTECVIREVREETGYEVKVLKLAAVYDRSRRTHLPRYPFSVYKMMFICEIIGGSPQASIETEAPTFFSLDELPELSQSRVLPFQLERMFAHALDPALPCECD